MYNLDVLCSTSWNTFLTGMEMYDLLTITCSLHKVREGFSILWMWMAQDCLLFCCPLLLAELLCYGIRVTWAADRTASACRLIRPINADIIMMSWKRCCREYSSRSAVQGSRNPEPRSRDILALRERLEALLLSCDRRDCKSEYAVAVIAFLLDHTLDLRAPLLLFCTALLQDTHTSWWDGTIPHNYVRISILFYEKLCFIIKMTNYLEPFISRKFENHVTNC